MSNSLKSSSRLVADQPALTVIAVGICLSLSLGLLVRGLLREERLKTLVETEVHKIQGARKVQVDRVSVSLAQGFFPDLSLQIDGFHLDSPLLCEMSPTIDINLMRFPISIWALIQGRIELERIDIDQALVILRTDLKDCGKDRKTAAAETETSLPQSTEPQLAKNKDPQSSVAAKMLQASSVFPFREMNLRKLRINYLPVAFSNVEMDSVHAEIGKQSPYPIRIDGQLLVSGETLSGDYSSRSFWALNFDPEKNPSGEFTLDGSWREGRYRIETHFDETSKDYDLKMSLEHLPLSQVFPVLKKYKIMESDFNGKKTWVSGEVTSKGQWIHMTQAPWDLKKIKLEGDLGEIAVDELHFARLEPLEYDPIQFDFKKLDLEALMVFLNRPHPSPALGRLGILEAKALFKNTHAVEISGVLKNLELIFSNKGSRQLQVLSQIQGAMTLTNDEWKGQVDQIQIQDGSFDGKLQLRADKDWKDLDLKLVFQKLRLSPKIEDLMTQNGSVGDLSGQIETHFEKGAVRKLVGQIQIPDLSVEGIHAEKTELQFENRYQAFGVRVKSAQVEFAEKSAATEIITSLREAAPEVLKNPSLESLTAQIETRSLDDFQWKALRAKSASAILESSGGWNSQGDLTGSLSWQERGKTKKWMIKGQRGSPQFLKK